MIGLKNTEFIFYISLIDTANRTDLKSNPTIAAGDFKVSTDGGVLGNLDTIPVVTPANSTMVKITLSADEMNGDNITVVGQDATGNEWDDHFDNIQTYLVNYIWDEVLTGATHNVATSSGRRLRDIAFGLYEGGCIWIDTVNGNDGAVDFTNGTVDNPVKNIADANTLATSLGLVRFQVAPGSSITFAAAQNNQIFDGYGWTLALGGQDVAGTIVIGATISGIASGTGTDQIYENCHLNSVGVTLIKNTHLVTCAINGTITVGEAGDYFLDRCYSGIAGATTWIWDFGGAIGSTNLNVRNYSGGIQVENMGDSGTDTMSLEGHGQLIEGTCTAGNVSIRGHFTKSGITNLTLSDDARYDINQVQAATVEKWLGVTVPSLNAATITTSVAATSITQFRGDDWSFSLTSLGAIIGNTEVWFSVKKTKETSEDNALIRITNDDGLERINGAAGTAANGTLIVDDAGDGDITVTLKSIETAVLAVGDYFFDVQWADSAGLITTIAEGTFTITADISKATS